MRYRLTATDGSESFELRGGTTLVVGRAPASDVLIIDPTISRRHAEVECDDDRVVVRDLGSSNGTFLNGTRIESAVVGVGDTITFGKVAFKLLQVAVPTPRDDTQRQAPVGETILRQLPMRDPSVSIDSLKMPLYDGSGSERQTLSPSDKSRQKLATLLEVSKGLGKATDIDSLLEKIVGYAYQILEVDFVAILLVDEQGELVPKIARDSRGKDTARVVPQSIARTAVKDKVAILSDNAGEDTRFGG
ncbi:MAG: FHA domain-containing protein, partial [Gemmatimonas sp.]